MGAQEGSIRVPRTARFHFLGDPATASRIWIVLHGYGQLARFFLNKFEGCGRDLCIVAPEGLNRFYVDEAHQRVGATWMTREDRENEIRDHVEYLDRLADDLRTKARPGTPLCVLGFSQGVATACRWALRGTTDVWRMVLWGGSIPPEIDRDRMQYRWKDLQVDVVHGTLDRLVPMSETERSIERLTAASVARALHVFEGGHDLEPVLLKRCLNTA